MKRKAKVLINRNVIEMAIITFDDDKGGEIEDYDIVEDVDCLHMSIIKEVESVSFEGINKENLIWGEQMDKVYGKKENFKSEQSFINTVKNDYKKITGGDCVFIIVNEGIDFYFAIVAMLK